MEELQISATAVRRLNRVTAAVLVGAVVGGVVWWDRASRRWWEEGRPFFPGYVRRWAGRAVEPWRNARRTLGDARVVAHDVSSARSSLRRG
jgi:hypothetical protein